ncbi:MAG: Ig-like domain-containing protein [Lachnospiraceae bacterium]|nr:Ig-like domain-containing protein [Lachnospiraceae bacterium]
MKHKGLAALVLSFIMLVGLLPVLPGNVKSVSAAGTVKNVVRSMAGITAPSTGWSSDFSSSKLMFARDISVNKSASLKLTDDSNYSSSPGSWNPVTSLTTSAARVDSTINSGVNLNNVFPGDSIKLVLSGSLNGESFDQTSVLFYNSNTNQVEAYGKIGDGTLGAKTINIPTGMSAGEYQMLLLLERFNTGGSVDQAFRVTTEYTVTVKSTAELKSVTFDFNTPPITRLSGGTLQQTNLTGAMEPVVFTVSDTSVYYFPENYVSLGLTNGITVTRNGLYQITVSGTPTQTSAKVTLANPATKAVQNPPTAVTTGVEKLQGTDTTMEYAASAGATSWTPCTAGSTSVAAGVWYVRYAGTDEKQPSSATQVAVVSSSDAHYVLINLPEDSHITRDTSGGMLYQYGLTSDMEPVILNANNGYYFPDTYRNQSKNGVTLQVMSESQIKISGKPNGGNVTFDITPATKRKTNPAKPASVAGDKMKITGTTDKMEYADAETPDTWNPCLNGETPVEAAGTKYVRYKETDTANASSVATVIVEEDPGSGNKTPVGGYTVMIETPKGSHITIGTESENLYRQTGITGAMQNVNYYADAGYYFPSSYKVKPVNGVRVVRSGATMLTVKGTPTDDTIITLDEAIDVNTPLYKATVINGTGTESYVAGTAVDITAADKSGLTFTGWKVNSGDVTLLNAKAKTTSFVMPARTVEVEACYSDGASADSGNTSGGASDNNSGSSSSSSSGNAAVTPAGGDTGNASTGGGSSSGGTTAVATPLPNETILNNSMVLDLSAKVKWNGTSWKVTWNKVAGADGYDVYACQGQATPSGSNYVQIAGNDSNRAFISTIGGSAVDKRKVYSFVVRAYRVVNKTKDYIGASRVLYAAGDGNKTYTNVKNLKPSKKTVTVKKGKRKKLQTKYKKQKSSRKLLSNSSGKKLNYYSSNKAVATVDAAGRVSGVSKGKCVIYILAHNGVRTSVTVKVK